MGSFRSHAGVLAAFALIWQIAALIFMPAAAGCGVQPAVAVEMPNCPMQHATTDAECPMHMKAAAGDDCHCPQLGCSPTAQNFIALLGPIGILPPAASLPVVRQTGDEVIVAASSGISLTSDPVAPPPRV